MSLVHLREDARVALGVERDVDPEILAVVDVEVMDDGGVPRIGDPPGVDEVVVVDVVPDKVGVARGGDLEGHAAVVCVHGPLLVMGQGPRPARVGEVANALVVGSHVVGPHLVDHVLEVVVRVPNDSGLGSERWGGP